MSATIKKETDDLIVISIEGVLEYNDLNQVEKGISSAIDRSRKVKLLALAESFLGWGEEGDWEDMSFMLEHDHYIEKIAIVAEEKWRGETLMFLGAGMRRAQVMIFQPGETDKARQWLYGENP